MGKDSSAEDQEEEYRKRVEEAQAKLAAEAASKASTEELENDS